MSSAARPSADSRHPSGAGPRSVHDSRALPRAEVLGAAGSPLLAWHLPAALAGVVRRYLQRGEHVEAVLAEISAINAELLARRELR